MEENMYCDEESCRVGDEHCFTAAILQRLYTFTSSETLHFPTTRTLPKMRPMLRL